MDNDIILKQILKRIDILISLQLEKPLSEKATTTADRIMRLRSLGLSATEIATIMGKTTNYVTATFSQKKKAPRKKRASKP